MNRCALHGILVVLAAMSFPVGAEEPPAIYVSPEGDDAHTGVEEKPFRTIARAQESARALAASTNQGVTVFLMDGTFVLEETWRLDARDANTTYRAADGARPVVSGARAVTGWAPDENGRWKAQVEWADFRQLYVNGKRAQRARGPAPENTERFGDLQYFDGDAGHFFPDEKMASWRNPSDIELGYYNSWAHMICKVRSITAENGRARVSMLQPWFMLASRKEGVQATTPAYVENALELLDEPGEWYFDKPARTLHYLPRDGEDMAVAKAAVPVLETLVEVRGTLGQPAANIRFEGITFADATWLGPNRIGHIDEQANFTFAATNIFERDGNLVNVHNEYIKSPANVVVHAGHGIHFEHCTFTRLGGAGLDLETGSRDTVVSRCRFFDIGGSAIQIGDVLAPDHHPDDPRLIVRGNRILNCEIHDIGVEYQDSIGVFAGYVCDTIIAHNHIHDLPYSGVSVGWGWGEADAGAGGYAIPYKYESPTPAANNRIEYNHIHDVMLRRNDGGGIYTLGNQPGTIIRGNHIHDNTVGGGPGGIYLDEGSGFIEITGNCVYNVATPMNYNNRCQNRIETCREHDNFFGIAPGEEGFPEAIAQRAGIEKL